jgi:AcrR family transcriptional regulator
MSVSVELGHRERLLEGLAESIREKGYLDTKIADVVRHARTSRRTFYEHFTDKEACFFALVDAAGALLREQVAAAVEPGASWDAQVDQAIDAYVAALTLDPQMTLSFSRELPALGARGSDLRREAMDRFAELTMRLVNTDENCRCGIGPISMDQAVMLTGGLNEVALRAVERGEDLRPVAEVAKRMIRAILRPAPEPGA